LYGAASLAVVEVVACLRVLQNPEWRPSGKVALMLSSGDFPQVCAVFFLSAAEEATLIPDRGDEGALLVLKERLAVLLPKRQGSVPAWRDKR